LTDFKVEMVISTIATAWITGVSNDLTGVLEAREGCTHMTVQNKPVTAVLDNTLGTSRHGVATTIVGAGCDPAGADSGDGGSISVSKVETVVHTTGC
jgi:hypothetical protein